jgi:O-antigen biosynthesis protein
MNNCNISIVIPTYNGKELLKRFLPSVMTAVESYEGEGEIIIVDDGGTDGSDVLIKSEFAGVRLIRNEDNKGFAGACNAGFKECANQIVILLNNDVLVDRDFIAPLVAHFVNKEVFGVRPGLRLLNNNTSQEDLERFSIGLEFKRGYIEVPMLKCKVTPDYNDIFLLGGTSAAFDKEKLSKLGGFDELFNPFYWEDADMSYRAWKRGWKILYEPKSMVYHQTHSTISKLYVKDYIEKISERNRYILVWKNVLDKKMLFNHFCWIPLRLFALLVMCRWHRILSLFLALRELGEIREKRKCELREAKISDFQLFSFFSGIIKNGTRY